MIMFSFGRMIYESEVELISDSTPKFTSIKYSPTTVKRVESAKYLEEIGSEITSTVILRNLGRTPARDMLVRLRMPTVSNLSMISYQTLQYKNDVSKLSISLSKTITCCILLVREFWLVMGNLSAWSETQTSIPSSYVADKEEKRQNHLLPTCLSDMHPR